MFYGFPSSKYLLYIIFNHRFSKCNCNLRRILPRIPQLCCISLLQRTCLKAQGLYYCFVPEFWRGKGKRENIAFSANGLIPPFFPFLTPVHLIWGNPRQSWILDSTMWIPDSRFQLLDSSLIQWNLDSGFQSLVGFQIHWDAFWIPKHRILDSTSENFPDSRIWIPLHGVNLPWRERHQRNCIPVVDPGEPSPYFFYQTEVRRPEKIFFGDCPPPYLRVWMTIPLPPLSQGLDPALDSVNVSF